MDEQIDRNVPEDFIIFRDRTTTYANLPTKFEIYAVHPDGRIFDVVKQQEVVPEAKRGTLCVALDYFMDIYPQWTMVDWIVAGAFVPVPEEIRYDRLAIKHKDGRESNCCADNLEWVLLENRSIRNGQPVK
jgi:hypothetical protein